MANSIRGIRQDKSGAMVSGEYVVCLSRIKDDGSYDVPPPTPLIPLSLPPSPGSIQSDLPMQRLSEIFNVNHFIVCQVNPHIVPVLRYKRFWNSLFMRWLSSEVRVYKICIGGSSGGQITACTAASLVIVSSQHGLHCHIPRLFAGITDSIPPGTAGGGTPDAPRLEQHPQRPRPKIRRRHHNCPGHEHGRLYAVRCSCLRPISLFLSLALVYDQNSNSPLQRCF